MDAPGPSDQPVPVPMPQWVISDTHLGHGNILAYCPWRGTWASTIEAHDAAIVTAWRDRVRETDWVLHLGDFSLTSPEQAIELRKSLPGRVILVRGNHDRSLTAMRGAGFDIVCSAARIEDGADRWFARHNPAAFTKNEAANARRILHGHCHGNGLHPDIHAAVRAKALDCSLDALRSVAPVAWDSVR